MTYQTFPKYTDISTSQPGTMDFSPWQNVEAKKPEIIDLELSFEHLQATLSNKYGCSELLQKEFPHLSTASGPKSLLKASIVFEHQGREISYEQMGVLMGITPNSAYQLGITLRAAYKKALGLTILSDQQGLRLCTANDGHEAIERLRLQFEKHQRSYQKLGEQIISCQRLGYQLNMSGRTQALLSAVLSKDEDA